jgi:predicted acyl esterase
MALMGRGRVAAALGALAVVAGSAAAPPAQARPTAPVVAPARCQTERSPAAWLAGADLAPTVHTSEDRRPVRYVQWRGTVPSFDGLPLSVDVAVPCGGSGRLPLVTMLGGFTDDKTVWEETGRSNTSGSTERPGSNARWNDIWLAGRGYAVLTYTARGWRDSCGPDTPDGGAKAARCRGHEAWIHLDDKRWEVRDAQWLTSVLVQGGLADPSRLAITGGSYGGAATASAAVLAGKVMCGAARQPKAYGPDPCTGADWGQLAPWRTPDGKVPLTWAAALPLYTFADLLQVLAPNGRWSDGWSEAPAGASPTDPVGVPLASTLQGLVAAGSAAGTFAPEGGDLSSDILTTARRLLAGDPFPQDERVIADGTTLFERYKSPVTTAPQGRVPIFWVQGHTDALFPAREALTMRAHLLAADADYPIKVFLGDLGHDYAAERQDDWDLVKGQMNAFLDHFLRPDRTPAAPRFDVGVSLARCLDADAAQTYLHAPDWDDLHPVATTLDLGDPGATSTREEGASGRATDPISTATLPGPDSYKGCRIVRPAAVDPTAATVDRPLDHALTVVGAPVVRATVASTGPDAAVAVRVWDVAPDGSAQGLVTRGVYRLGPAAPEGTELAFQLWPTGYRFEAGHRIRVEVTGNDAPYLLANRQPADLDVRDLRLVLPTYRPGAGAEEGDPEATTTTGGPRAEDGTVLDPVDDGDHDGVGAGWVVGGTFAGVLVGLGLWAWLRSRRRRPTATDAASGDTQPADDDTPPASGDEPPSDGVPTTDG